jgi:TonB-like protein
MTRASWGFLLTLIAATLAFAQDKHVDSVPPHIYHLGEGVSVPKATFSPTPEYTTEAAKKKIEGTVLLSLIVLPDGTPRNVAVSKGLGSPRDTRSNFMVRLSGLHLCSTNARSSNSLTLDAKSPGGETGHALNCLKGMLLIPHSLSRY